MLKLNQSNEEKNILINELKRIEDELNKKSNDINKEKLNNELIKIKKNLDIKNKHITKLEDELDKKSVYITKLDNKIKNLDTEKNNEIKDELENVYKSINKKRQENNELNILNDRLIKKKKEEEINKYQNELNEYQNELNRKSNKHSQKIIKLSNELEQKIKNLEQKNKELEQKIEIVESQKILLIMNLDVY